MFGIRLGSLVSISVKGLMGVMSEVHLRCPPDDLRSPPDQLLNGPLNKKNEEKQ